MRRFVGIASLLLFAVTPATAQKVHVDFDKTVDFEAFKTFAYFEHEDNNLADDAPMAHARIVQLLRDRMVEAGLQEVENDPELYVTYHGESRKEMGVNTVSMGYYGYGPGWGWDPYWGWGGSVGTTTASTYTYEVGTFIVDIWSRENRQLIWRGATEDTVREDPEKQFQRIEAALYKMGKVFRKQYRKVKKQRGD